jgi:hypothetical protein
MAWVPFPRGTEGVEVLDDGTIRLSGPRAQALTYDKTINPSTNKLDALKARKIRFTAAVPLDHAVRFGYKLSTDPSSLPTGTNVETDIENVSPQFLRQYQFKAGQNAKKYLRKDSYPVPQSVVNDTGNPTEQAEDKLGSSGGKGNALRDDSEFLMNQAQRRLQDVGRLSGKKSIFLAGLVLHWAPGDMIDNISGEKFKRVVSEVILHTGNETQVTELVCE